MPEESKERSAFNELQKTKIQIYVEEVLAPHFCVMIQFINECEPLVEQNNSQSLTKYSGCTLNLLTLISFLGKLTQIVKAFAAGKL